MTCPACHVTFEAVVLDPNAFPDVTEYTPSHGDIWACGNCGAAAMYCENGSLRVMSDGEVQAFRHSFQRARELMMRGARAVLN